jgi:hypothetical protein
MNANLLKLQRSYKNLLANLQFKQTSSYGPRAEGYAYAEMPDWLLKQHLEIIETELGESVSVPKTSTETNDNKEVI